VGSALPEFEDWQLDWLLEKPDGKLPLGKNLHPVKKIGFRPLLRYFTRYYIVYAERIS
jgi:hypothetical protein